MHIAFGKHEVEVATVQDFAQLEALLATCDGGKVILRGDFGAATYHACIVFRGRSGLEDLRRVGVGIVCAGFSLPPVLLMDPVDDRLLIGYNTDLVGIDFDEPRVAFSIRLGSPFYSMYRFTEQNLLLVFHEIGVLMMTLAGTVLWSFAEDIITSAKVAQDSLSLQFMDSPPVTLDLLTGERRSVTDLPPKTEPG